MRSENLKNSMVMSYGGCKQSKLSHVIYVSSKALMLVIIKDDFVGPSSHIYFLFIYFN